MGKIKVPTDADKEKEIKDRRRLGTGEDWQMQSPDSRYW